MAVWLVMLSSIGAAEHVAGLPQLTEVTGTFVAGGVECPLFRTEDGRGFALTGIDRAAAKVGTKARLWGQPVEFSTCQQGDAFAVERFELDGG